MQEEKNNEFMLTPEKSGIDKLLKDIKDSAFSVIYVLLEEEDQGLFRLFIENAIDYIQMLQFIFHQKIQGVWKADGVLENLFSIFRFFAIAQYFSGTFTFTLYLVIFYTCIAAIVLTVLDIVYVSYSFSKKRFDLIWPLQVLRSVVGLSVTVFFLPITEFLVNIVQCETNPDDGLSYLSSYPTVQCWAGMHIVHAVVGILNMVVFVSISLVVALNYYESKLSSTDPTAR